MSQKLVPWAFVLAVPDIERSATYFHDVLGFEISWQEAPDWRLVQRGDVRVMLGLCPTDVAPSRLGSHNWFGYIDISDVDAFYTDVTARGAICTPPADRPYGMREILVTTIDGHRVVFGQELGRRPSS